MLESIDQSFQQALIEQTLENLYYIGMQPGNLIELAMALFVGISVLTVIVAKIHVLSKSGSASLLLALFAVVLCSIFLIQVAVFTEVWLIPRTHMVNTDAVVISGGLLIAFLFVVVPATRILLHSSYFVSMVSWFIGLAGTLGAIYLLSFSYEESGPGATPIDTLQNVKSQVEQKIENASLRKQKP